MKHQDEAYQQGPRYTRITRVEHETVANRCEIDAARHEDAVWRDREAVVVWKNWLHDRDDY